MVGASVRGLASDGGGAIGAGVSTGALGGVGTDAIVASIRAAARGFGGAGGAGGATTGGASFHPSSISSGRACGAFGTGSAGEVPSLDGSTGGCVVSCASASLPSVFR